MPHMLNATEDSFETAFQALLSAKREEDADVDDTVGAIIADVRRRGDAALIELTAKFDRLTLDAGQLPITETEIEAALTTVSKAEMDALNLAASRIRAYHERQRPQDATWTDESGATLGWRWTPVPRASYSCEATA